MLVDAVDGVRDELGEVGTEEAGEEVRNGVIGFADGFHEERPAVERSTKSRGVQEDVGRLRELLAAEVGGRQEVHEG